jgi:hypothetical protein
MASEYFCFVILKNKIPNSQKKLKMKKIILFAAVIAFNYASAQMSSNSTVLNSKTQKQYGYDQSVNMEPSKSEVHAKAISHFTSNHPNASSAQWTALEDKSAVCRFYENENLQRAYYNPKGKWSGTISTYKHSLLPGNIKRMAEISYPEYVIKLVNEVKVPNLPSVYILHVESLKYFKLLRATNEDGIAVVQDFELAK